MRKIVAERGKKKKGELPDVLVVESVRRKIRRRSGKPVKKKNFPWRRAGPSTRPPYDSKRQGILRKGQALKKEKESRDLQARGEASKMEKIESTSPKKVLFTKGFPGPA